MRHDRGFYVAMVTVSVLGGVLLYIISYYMGPRYWWGYHSVPASLFKASLPAVAIILALVVDRVRNG